MEVENFIKLCSRSFEFKVPLARPFPPNYNWKVQFKNSVGDTEAKTFIEKVSLCREDMIAALGANVTLTNKLEALDAYIPLLFQLVRDTQHAQKECEVSYQWTTTIANQASTPSDGFFKHPDIMFEVFMTLFSKAIVLNSTAATKMNMDNFNFIAECGKHYLAASSIMTYLKTCLSGSNAAWVNYYSEKNYKKPLEITTVVTQGYAALFKTSAQALSVVKVLGNEAATPPLLRSKLCVGVFNTAVEALTPLSSVVSAETYFAYLMHHLAITREVFAAMTHLYAGIAQYEKKEVGAAMGHANAGKPRLQQQAGKKFDTTLKGLPKFKDRYADLAPGVTFLESRLNSLYATAEKDNKFIHFQSVPAPSALETPPEISVMNPIPFVEPFDPERSAIPFTYIPPPTLTSSVFKAFSNMMTSDKPASSSGGTAAAAPVPAAAAAAATAAAAPAAACVSASSAQSDEEMARALQAQYDREGSSGAPAVVPAAAAPAPVVTPTAMVATPGMSMSSAPSAPPAGSALPAGSVSPPSGAFTIVVPAGCSAGTQLTVMSPTGQTCMITVPAGHGPGSQLVVQPH